MNLPWMPIFIGDELAETASLSTEEFGAYHLLLMALWQHGKLPGDDARLARIARLDASGWASVREAIEPLFGPGWTHEKLEERRRSAEAERDKKSEAGRKAARARWSDMPSQSDRNATEGATADADAYATAMPVQSGRNALHPHPHPHLHPQDSSSLRSDESPSLRLDDEPAPMPSRRQPPKPKVTDADLSADFDRFWDQYPRRVSKGQAQRAYLAARRRGVSAETILNGALRYAGDPGREDRFTKHPATWLNGECWADEPSPLRARERPRSRSDETREAIEVLLSRTNLEIDDEPYR